jgi:tetratricopeptide (TPR) repeat protein
LGIEDEQIPLSLNVIGTIYRNALSAPNKAIIYYSKGIKLMLHFERYNHLLGDLFYNRALVQEDSEKQKEDFLQSISVFQNIPDIDKLIIAYHGIATFYAEKDDFVNALHYGLLGYNLSYHYKGSDNIKSTSLSNDIIALYKICTETNIINQLSNQIIFDLTIYLSRNNYKKRSSEEIEHLINAKVHESLYIASDEKQIEEDKFSELYIILHEIIEFEKRYGRLPQLSNYSIEVLFTQIVYYKSLYNNIITYVEKATPLRFINYPTTQILKWQCLCIYLYIKYAVRPVNTDTLMLSIYSFNSLGIKCVPLNGILYETTFQVLYYFIYYIYMPQNRFDYALQTINLIIEEKGTNNEYLDCKAEILYRLGNISEAKDIIKRIMADDPKFYPDGNEFLYNELIRSHLL